MGQFPVRRIKQYGVRQSASGSIKVSELSLVARERVEEDGLLGKTHGGLNQHLLPLLQRTAKPNGSKIDFRVCDSYACELSLLDGYRECEQYWPRANRDCAVEAWRAFLHRYANNLRYRDPEDCGRDNPDRDAAGPPIHFPVLNYPATLEDVDAGRAVFSLPTPSRVCRVLDLPVSVNRPGKPTDARDANTGSTLAGEVWQAEETLVEGRWERFYGFVSRHQMAWIPAVELVFRVAGSSESAPVTPQISGASKLHRVSSAKSFSCRVVISVILSRAVPPFRSK